MNDRLHALMVTHGALVFIVGLLAGFPFAFLVLGKITLWPIPGSLEVAMPGDVRGWRMAHLEGILNGLTLFAVAAVGARIQLTPGAQRTIAWSLILTAWANVIASVIGPIFGGRGLAFGDGAANSVMYLLFVAAIGAVLIAMVQLLLAALRGARR